MSGATLSSRPGAPPVQRPRTSAFLATRAAKLTVFYLLLTAMAIVFLGPYILTLFAAFKPIGKIFSEPAWTPPGSLDLSNFEHDFADAGFYRYLANTALVTGVLTLGQVFFSTLAAYAFARMSFPAGT
jgi:multiple sugar transport system permease protein